MADDIRMDGGHLHAPDYDEVHGRYLCEMVLCMSCGKLQESEGVEFCGGPFIVYRPIEVVRDDGEDTVLCRIDDRPEALRAEVTRLEADNRRLLECLKARPDRQELLRWGLAVGRLQAENDELKATLARAALEGNDNG